MSSMDPGTVAYSETAMRNLRPLSIGEMLDRAFTICLKNFVPSLSLVAVVMIAVMTVLIAFFIVGAALGVIAGFLGIVGTIVAVIIGIAAGLTALLFTFQLYLAAAYSFVTVVLEGSGPIVACGSGFARVFGAGQFWRSLGIAASLFGIILGLYLVGAVVGGITIALTRSFSMEFVVSGLVGAFGYPFLFAVVAVSYYDVRIRREGFDLQ